MFFLSVVIFKCFFVSVNNEYLVIFGKIDVDFGVIKVLFLVMLKKLVVLIFLIFVCVYGFK